MTDNRVALQPVSAYCKHFEWTAARGLLFAAAGMTVQVARL
ncbi:MAG: hypothetical protein Q7U75_15720 [Desulfobacterales bacterium]|nr:hypothetical protein [Desulfobacterales bacterium]